MAQLTLVSTRLKGTFVTTRDTGAATSSYGDTVKVNAEVTFTPLSTASHPQSAKMTGNPEGFGVVFEPVRARIINGALKPYTTGGATVVLLPTFKEMPQRWRISFEKVTFAGKPVHGGIKSYEFKLPFLPATAEFDIVKALPLRDGDYSVASSRVYIIDTITNDKNELVFVMSDGSQQVLSHSFFDQAASDAADAKAARDAAVNSANEIRDSADAIAADAADARNKASEALAAASSASAQVDGKVTTFISSTMPVNTGTLGIGDMWFKTTTTPWTPHVWSGDSWLESADPTAREAAQNAQNAADTAIAAADGKIESFYSPTAPSSDVSSVGDLWIRTTDNMLHRWNGVEWKSVQDTAIATAKDKADDALAEAAAAALKADGKAVTYIQSTEPTGLAYEDIGDFWYNTANDPWTPFVWSGYMWIQSKDADATAAANAAQQVAADAIDAVDQKITTYMQNEMPEGDRLVSGDLWVKSPENTLFRWTLNTETEEYAWTEVQDGAIMAAADAAESAAQDAATKITSEEAPIVSPFWQSPVLFEDATYPRVLIDSEPKRVANSGDIVEEFPFYSPVSDRAEIAFIRTQRIRVYDTLSIGLDGGANSVILSVGIYKKTSSTAFTKVQTMNISGQGSGQSIHTIKFTPEIKAMPGDIYAVVILQGGGTPRRLIGRRMWRLAYSGLSIWPQQMHAVQNMTSFPSTITQSTLDFTGSDWLPWVALGEDIGVRDTFWIDQFNTVISENYWTHKGSDRYAINAGSNLRMNTASGQYLLGRRIQTLATNMRAEVALVLAATGRSDYYQNGLIINANTTFSYFMHGYTYYAGNKNNYVIECIKGADNPSGKLWNHAGSGTKTTMASSSGSTGESPSTGLRFECNDNVYTLYTKIGSTWKVATTWTDSSSIFKSKTDSTKRYCGLTSSCPGGIYNTQLFRHFDYFSVQSPLETETV